MLICRTIAPDEVMQLAWQFADEDLNQMLGLSWSELKANLDTLFAQVLALPEVRNADTDLPYHDNSGKPFSLNTKIGHGLSPLQ
jgi:hypothetical protein